MLDSLATWADAHRGRALDVVRVYLGAGLFVRGVVFLADPSAYLSLVPGPSQETLGSLVVLNYVGLAHVCGGLLLAAGLLTRLAALVQIPVLAGAALLHLPSGVADQSFAFAALVLALLAVFAVWGGGPWSLDQAVAVWTARDDEAEGRQAAEALRRLRVRERERAPAPPRPALAAGGIACGCGHDREHPRVEAERLYGALGAMRFATGTHPRPSAVVFRCRDCDGAVETVDAPEDLEAFRYERSTRGARTARPGA
ncbi:DoxX family membrane protein [Rubrivirga sp. S365]|uniref:DoxX family membrane protein n=1 Tax=Rubrivirga sp. S365 TaxID=3076080 RepID=UPI0028C696C2|nr:DoxX family membrane protein [Rubrivirga sp. S365]MDT7856415.1 DoxX family membrane protein [Rubrivirga sp. S365]